MNRLQRLRHIGYVNRNTYSGDLSAKLFRESWFDSVTRNVQSQRSKLYSQCCINVRDDKFRCVKETYFSRYLQRKALCTNADKAADTFGTIGHENYEVFEMDEDEREEEEYETYQPIRPHRYSVVYQEHYSKIRKFVGKNDLQSALETLSTMKEMRVHPKVEIYNLLMYGFAQQGDLKMCLKLYNELRKRGLEPKPATYTSIINACSECQDSKQAIKALHKLRKDLYEKGYQLNITHYHVLIKAYSHHGFITHALQIADEMKDKNIPFTERTYSILLHCASGDHENGLRYALGIWHLMRLDGIKPDLHVYNSILMAIRDANISNLELNEALIPGKENITIISNSNETVPDLLASPPVVNPLLLSQVQKVTTDQVEPHAVYPPQQVEVPKKLTQSILSNIIQQNRLILFGGAQSILKKMQEDNVKPNCVTLTLLMILTAPSVKAEADIIKYAKKNKVQLDMVFYNVLIKKRVNRNDYNNAKAVLNLMQLEDLQPDVVTFGILSVGCTKQAEYQEFISGMESSGLMPNKVILATFIYNACRKKDTISLKMLIDYMLDNRIKGSSVIFEIVDRFIELSTNKWGINRGSHAQKEHFQKFLTTYEKLQKTRKPEVITTKPPNKEEDNASA